MKTELMDAMMTGMGVAGYTFKRANGEGFMVTGIGQPNAQLKDIQVNNIGVFSKYISTLSIQEEDPDYTWLKETVASYKAIKGDK